MEHDQVTDALAAFARFVASVEDSEDVVVDEEARLTGAMLHTALRVIADMAVDYEALIPPS